MVRSKYTFHKREREKARKEKQEEKRARRMEAKKLRSEDAAGASDDGFPMAGIKPDSQLSADQGSEGKDDSTVDEREG